MELMIYHGDGMDRMILAHRSRRRCTSLHVVISPYEEVREAFTRRTRPGIKIYLAGKQKFRVHIYFAGYCPGISCIYCAAPSFAGI